MKFAVIITLKKDVLDPQGKVIEQTLEGMGVNNLKNLRQGKYIEIELNELDEKKAYSTVAVSYTHLTLPTSDLV